MINDLTTIAVDAMGGDNSPYKALKGVEIFLQSNPKVKLALFGNGDLINKTIDKNKININNYEIFDTVDNIENDDSASTILRQKKELRICLCW